MKISLLVIIFACFVCFLCMTLHADYYKCTMRLMHTHFLMSNTLFFMFSNIIDAFVIAYILYFVFMPLSCQFCLLLGWNLSLIEIPIHVGWTSIKIVGNPLINCRLDVNQNEAISVFWALGPYLQWIVWMLIFGKSIYLAMVSSVHVCIVYMIAGWH